MGRERCSWSTWDGVGVAWGCRRSLFEKGEGRRSFGLESDTEVMNTFVRWSIVWRVRQHSLYDWKCRYWSVYHRLRRKQFAVDAIVSITVFLVHHASQLPLLCFYHLSVVPSSTMYLTARAVICASSPPPPCPVYTVHIVSTRGVVNAS